MAFTKSILRYPGGKNRFADFIGESMKMNGFKSKKSGARKPLVFAEPFCGGASVSISLLEEGVVDMIALNDADPLVSALWDTVFSTAAGWLVEQVMTVPLTLEEWDRQRNLEPSCPREQALKCLYLNRTSFNGILHKGAGPVGGRSQEKRTLAARFSREKLARRILELSALQGRVHSVSNCDWRSFMERVTSSELGNLGTNVNAFFYLDPPYYHKADKLYSYCFSHDDHVALRDFLVASGHSWMLSYDDAPEVRELYRGGVPDAQVRVIDNTYSAHPIGGASFIGRELFYSSLQRLPSPHGENVEHVGFSVKKYGAKKPGAKATKGEAPVVRIPTTSLRERAAA